MRLKQGSRLGRLEIVEFIDAGGMGEVYRARDPELDREVAIKVLPAEVVEDEARIERFEREARAVGRLRHPNILGIHDIGRHEGAPYLVCELLEGRTLREVLESTRLPLGEALSIAAQIAAGLAAAHAEGVVHRDLKPGNVMISGGGEVKILDFGLAKLTGRTDEDPSAQPTLTAMTAPQTVLGTAAYMSPEQVAGRPVDFRADQFALGIVLHEVLSGGHPFERETAPEVMAAILKEEPASLEASVPPPVRWVVERCLEKDPGRRYASTSDLARDLATLKERLRELEPVVEGPDRPRRAVLPLALGALALVATTVFVALQFAGEKTGEAEQLQFEQVTFRRGTVTGARFDPEGESVIYSAAWEGQPNDIFLATPGTPDPLRVGPDGSVLLAVSDLRELLLSSDRKADGPFLRTGLLSRKPVTGAPRVFDESISEAVWGPDGEVLAVVRDVNRESVLESPPGERRYATGGMIWSLRATRDGERLAFIDVGHRGSNVGSIVVLAADGNPRRFGMTGDLQGLAWSPDDREVWFARANNVVAVDLEGRERVVATLPQRVVLHDVARDGRVLLSVEPSRWEMAGKPPGVDSERDLSWLSYSLPFAITADRSSVLFNDCRSTAVCTVGLRGFDGGPPVLLGDGFAVAISPDGSQVASIRPWRAAELALIPTGPGERRVLDLTEKGITRANLASWALDGTRLFLNADDGQGSPHAYELDLETNEVTQITTQPIRWGFISVAPDDERIAVQLADGQTVVVPIAGGEPVPVPGLYEQPVQWSTDGRSLYTFEFGKMPLEVKRVDVATGASEVYATLEPQDTAGAMGIGPLAITPDGDGYVYGYPRRLSVLQVVKGMR